MPVLRERSERISFGQGSHNNYLMHNVTAVCAQPHPTDQFTRIFAGLQPYTYICKALDNIVFFNLWVSPVWLLAKSRVNPCNLIFKAVACRCHYAQGTSAFAHCQLLCSPGRSRWCVNFDQEMFLLVLFICPRMMGWSARRLSADADIL